MDINEKKAKIAEVLASGSPFTIGALGKAIEGSALEAARLLPAVLPTAADLTKSGLR